MQSENFSNEQLVTPIPMSEPRTSGMAIASLVLGILGFCVPCLSAMVGLILGIIALVAIGRSQGVLKGKGLAIAGIVCSAISMLIVPVLLAILMPALAHVKTLAYKELCGTNLKGVANAMQMYSSDNKGKLPTGNKWCDLLISDTGLPKQTLVCKASKAHLNESSYAMNKHAVGKSSDLPPDMVLIFESKPGWNQVGGPELLTTDNHDPQGCSILLVDGTVEFVKPDDVDRLRWKPDNSSKSPAPAPTPPTVQRIQAVMEIRIVPNLNTTKSPTIPMGNFVHYSDDLIAHGPDAATTQGRDYAWFKLKDERIAGSMPGLPTAQYKGQTYILLCTSPTYSMSTTDLSNGVWNVVQASRGTDRDGNPAVSFVIDGVGPELFNKLTSRNPRNKMAIAVCGEVRSVTILEAALWDRGIIAGQFTEDEISEMVNALNSGGSVVQTVK